jgi:indolepyruvate ferredoxin oxidoreductase alpha subunit
MMNIIGGMVVVLGDDPGANSSQNEQDNRHLARLCYTPVMEPASPAEVYRFYREAALIARQMAMPVILRLTTHVCHAKERVAFDAWQPAEWDHTPRFDPQNGPYIPIATDVFPLKRIALKRLSEVEALDGAASLNREIDNGNAGRGIITAGMPFLSVMDVLSDISDKPDILKLGMIYPLPRKLIRHFLKTHSQIRIIEELDDILEKDIKSLAFDEALPVRITGKMDAEDWVGEYTPDKVHAILSGTWPDLIRAIPVHSGTDKAAVPRRPPQLCPGCGHRSAFHAIKKALKDTDISVADIGCHTLGFLPPYQMGQLLMCMGASPGIGAGLSLFNTERKVVAFLGDSTFYHAGLPGIINAVFNRHPITLILMENGTTAMTGHQDHAGSGRNFNEVTDKIPVRKVLEGLGVKHVFETDTYQQSTLTELVQKATAIPEFSVVIARHPCMLKFMREQRKKSGFVAKKVRIDPDTCQRIHECVEKFGCPTFVRSPDGSVGINPDLCIGDGSCRQTCPVSAIVQ